MFLDRSSSTRMPNAHGHYDIIYYIMLVKVNKIILFKF